MRVRCGGTYHRVRISARGPASLLDHEDYRAFKRSHAVSRSLGGYTYDWKTLPGCLRKLVLIQSTGYRWRNNLGFFLALRSALHFERVNRRPPYVASHAFQNRERWRRKLKRDLRATEAPF